jgi:hypothetical protein
MSDRYAVVALDAVVPYETEGQPRLHTIRRRLDIRAFGMNAWTASSRWPRPTTTSRRSATTRPFPDPSETRGARP